MITKNAPIGIRVLTRNMMNCSFNHTDEVLATIEKIRTTAYTVQDEFRNSLLNFPNQGVMEARGYNNAISILGSRGAGKTSIIMTLQHILRYGKDAWEKNRIGGTDKENILMPILVPQDFSQGQSLLSWVIMQLLQKGEEIERIITTEQLYMCGMNGPFAKWDNSKQKYASYDPLRECMDNLTNSYELRYKRDAGYEAADSEHVYEYMDEVRRDARLVFDMLKLVSMIVDFYRYQQSKVPTKKDTEREPLIFFVIDDLDLAPSRSQEVLNLVLRYLQHPNIVVLCGWNQELFQSHLCMDLLKTQGALDTKLLDTNFGYDDVFMTRQRKRVAALDSARRLAMDNLKKAFPPALRYEIRGLSTVQRAWFPNTPTNESIADRVDCFLNVIRDALRACRADENAPVEFLYNNGKAIWAYMRIFDNKARGMVNTYLAFQMLQQSVAHWDKKSEFDITSLIIALIDTLLFSNTHFVPYRRGLRDLIRIEKVVISPEKEKTICEYYCNFKSAEEILREYYDEKENVDGNRPSDKMFFVERQYNYFPSLVIDAYILLNFVENMLEYICMKPNYEHGGLEFSRILNRIVPPIRNSPDPDDLLSCAFALSGIEKVDLFPETRDFRANMLLLNAYEKERLSDESYEFTGVHSYCSLSRALSDTVGVGPEKKKQTDRLVDLNRDWFHSMERLLGSLYYSVKNVKRLTIYRNLLYQNRNELDWDAMILVDSLADKVVNIQSWNRTGGDERPITMSELNDIAYIVRCVYTFIRKWKQIKKNDKPAVARGKIETRLFVQLFAKYADGGIEKVIDVRNYKKEIENYRRDSRIASEMEEAAETPSDDRELLATVEIATRYAKRNIDLLLNKLKTRLQCTCYNTFARKENVYEQFLHLIDVSKRIPDILDKLQLGEGVWTMRENNAVFDLMEVLREYDIVDLYSDVREIFELGPKLAQTGRDTYIQCLQRIKRGVDREHRFFAKKDLTRMELSIEVLQDAYQNIQRDMEVEEQLKETVLSFGRDVAAICAELSVHSQMPDGRSEGYQREVMWPVAMKDREEFVQWKMPTYEQGLFT